MQKKSNKIKNIFDKNIVKNIEIKNVKDLSNFTNILLDSEKAFCNNQYIYILEYLMNIYFEKLYLAIQDSPPDAKIGGGTPNDEYAGAGGARRSRKRGRSPPVEEDSSAGDSDADEEGLAAAFEVAQLLPQTLPADFVADEEGLAAALEGRDDDGAPPERNVGPMEMDHEPPRGPALMETDDDDDDLARAIAMSLEVNNEHVTKLRVSGWTHGKKLHFETFNREVFTFTISNKDSSVIKTPAEPPAEPAVPPAEPAVPPAEPAVPAGRKTPPDSPPPLRHGATGDSDEDPASGGTQMGSESTGHQQGLYRDQQKK